MKTTLLLVTFPVAACFSSYGAYELGRLVGMSDFMAYVAGCAMSVGWASSALYLLDVKK